MTSHNCMLNKSSPVGVKLAIRWISQTVQSLTHKMQVLFSIHTKRNGIISEKSFLAVKNFSFEEPFPAVFVSFELFLVL